MNTARMDLLLDRQKKNLVTDALYALVVVIALAIYLLGLGIGTSPATVARTSAVPAQGSVPSDLGTQCTPVVSAAGNTSWVC